MSGKRAKRLRREESDGGDERRTGMTRAEARDLFKRADAIGEFIADDALFNAAYADEFAAVEQAYDFRMDDADAVLSEMSDESGALAAMDNLHAQFAAVGAARAAAARAAAIAVRADAVAQGYPPAQAALYAVAYVKSTQPVVESWLGSYPPLEEIPAAYADEFACSPYGRTYAAVYAERIAAGYEPFHANQIAGGAAEKADEAQSAAEFEAMLDAYGDHLETRPGIFVPAVLRNALADEREDWA